MKRKGVFRITYLVGVAMAIGLVVGLAGIASANIGYNKGVYNKDTTAEAGNGSWTTGNAGKNYKEDQWVYYQYEITGITGSQVPTFNVVYNFWQSNTNAIFIDAFSDFRYRWFVPSPGNPSGMLPDDQAYPGTSTSTWRTWLPNKVGWDYSETTHQLTAPGTDAPVPIHGFAVDNPTDMFATDAPTSGTNNSLVIFFRAHLTSSVIWMGGDENTLGNANVIPLPTDAVPSGIAGIFGEEVFSTWQDSYFGVGFATGSSRHFNLQDQSDGSSGAITLPIPTVGANYILVKKVTVPSPATGTFVFAAGDDSSTFNITPASFNLDTDPATADTFDTIRFSDLQTGQGGNAVTYTFTENSLPDGWSLTSIATENLIGSSTFTTNLATKTATVRLDPDGAAIVTFTNTRLPETPTLTTYIHDASHNIVGGETHVPLGTTVHDNATASATPSWGVPSGDVTFSFYKNIDGSGTPFATSGAIPLVNGSVDATGFPQGPLGAGSYSFRAHFTSANTTRWNNADSAVEPLTVDKGTLTLVTTMHNASHGAVANGAHLGLGSVLHDNAVLNGAVVGFTPTGAVSFTFSGGSLGAAPGSPEAGFYATSGDTAALGASATAYSFSAAYAGDSNYNAIASGTHNSETFFIDKGTLAITTTIHDASHNVVGGAVTVPAGAVVHDTATVTGNVTGFAIPAISFTLNGNPVATSASPDPPATARSVDSAPLLAGNYNYQASVATDSNYIGATSALEPLTVIGQFGKTFTLLSPTLPPGQAWLPLNTVLTWKVTYTVPNDTGAVMKNATLSDRFGAELELGDPLNLAKSQGTVEFSTNKGASEQLRVEWNIGDIPVGGVATLSFNVSTDLNPAGKQEFTSAGIHVLNSGASLKWRDANNKQQSKTSNTWSVQVGQPTPPVTTQLSAASLVLPGSVTDTATVQGLPPEVKAAYGGPYPGPTGNVTFQVRFGGGAFVAFSENVSLSGAAATSAAYAPAAPGTYYFRALYTGDINYQSSQSGDTAEPLAVKATPVVTTVLSKTSITLGDNVTDNVTVAAASPGFPVPGGTVEFWVSTDNGSNWTKFDTKTLVAGKATSALYIPGNVSSEQVVYLFQARYLGDANYVPAMSGVREELLQVNP